MAGVMVVGLSDHEPSEIALICGCPRVAQQGRRRKSSTGAAAKVTPKRSLSKESSHFVDARWQWQVLVVSERTPIGGPRRGQASGGTRLV